MRNNTNICSYLGPLEIVTCDSRLDQGQNNAPLGTFGELYCAKGVAVRVGINNVTFSYWSNFLCQLYG